MTQSRPRVGTLSASEDVALVHAPDAAAPSEFSIEARPREVPPGQIRPSSAHGARRLPHRWLWRRYARVYDALEGLSGYREMLVCVLAAAGPVEGGTVVEVGCGTGNLLTRLLQGHPAHLAGIDTSAAMLAWARGKLSDAPTGSRVELREADAVAGLAEVPAGSVDVLVASNLLYALADRPAFWQAAARVLRHDGRVVVSNPDRPGFGPAARQQWRTHGVAGFADRRLLEVLLLNVAIDALAVTQRYEFASWSVLAAEAAEAGLPRAVLHGRCYGGPTHGMNVVGVLARV